LFIRVLEIFTPYMRRRGAEVDNEEVEEEYKGLLIREDRATYGAVVLRERLLTYNIKILPYVSALSRTEKMNTACSVVVMNLLSCISKDRRLVYSRDTRGITKKTNKWMKKHNKHNLSTYKIIKAVNTLEEKGYLINHLGFAHKQEDKRIISTLLPTQKLIAHFKGKADITEKADEEYMRAVQLIILRDRTTKQEKEYPLTAETENMSDIVRAINAVNAKHTFTTSDGEVLDNSKAVRIFSGTMNSGGRYYHNDVLNIKQRAFIDGKLVVKPVQETRLGMLIDGESVVEVDFACLHPMLLMDIEGCDKAMLQGDIYSAMLSPQQLTNPANRQLMKLTVNFMLNAESEASARATIREEIQKHKESYDVHNASAVMATVKGVLHPIAHHFCLPDCTGLWLQYLDSRIMELVFEDFIAADKPVVSVHDSALVRKQDTELLVESMANAYRTVVGDELGETAEHIDVYMKMSLPDGSSIKITA